MVAHIYLLVMTGYCKVLARVGDKLLTTCLEAGSRDNMSVLIVVFPASGLAYTPTSLLSTSLSESEA